MSGKFLSTASRPAAPEPEYSNTQYLMWLIGGSEISILKNCPADYNRHATIGFTLLMTCLFAAVAGGYAGYFFSESIGASTVVALIWGLLVYSIDRSMVVSLKKNPEKKQNYWPQLIVRAILGFLIAFFISIPLELLIFKESIDMQVQVDRIRGIKDFGQEVSGTYKPEKYEAEENRQQQKADKLQKALNDLPPTEEYRSKKEVQDQAIQQETVLNQQLQAVRSQKNRFLGAVPRIIAYRPDGTSYDRGPNKSSSQWRNYLAKRQEESRVTAALQQQQAERTLAEQTLVSYLDGWRKEKNIELNLTLEDGRTAGIRKKKANDDTDSTRRIYQQTIKNQNGFVRRFVALENAANADESRDLLGLLWLVRAIFILIEILPTVVKNFTPTGQYDWAIYQAEKDFIEITLQERTNLLQADAQQEQIEARRQQSFRLQHEGDIHDEIVKKLADVQTSIAKRVLDEYERQQISQAPQNVESYVRAQTQINNRS